MLNLNLLLSEISNNKHCEYKEYCLTLLLLDQQFCPDESVRSTCAYVALQILNLRSRLALIHSNKVYMFGSSNSHFTHLMAYQLQPLVA